MVSKQLDSVSKRLGQLESRAKTDIQWDSQSLVQLNETLHQILEGIRAQVAQWQLELDAREELQARLLDVPPPSEQTKRLWWFDQLAFYEALLDRMYHFMCVDDDARVTTSLKAQEILLLVRLMVAGGMLQAETLHPIFRHLARFVGTEKHSKLSYESLKKRYSLRHEPTRKNVKQMLINMLRLIDK